MATFIEVKGKKKISIKAIIRVAGYKTITKNFSGITRAKQWAQKIEVQMKEGTYQEVDLNLDNNFKMKFERLEDLINYFRDEIAPKRYSYHEKYFVMYDWWARKIGKIKVKDINASILTACINSLANEKIKKGGREVTRSNSTLNKYMMALSAILTYASKQLEIIEYNPMSKISTFKKPDGRKRFLNKDDAKKLAQKCKENSDVAYIFFLLLISTGGRYSEVLHLRVEDIDFRNNRVHYLDTKNGTNRGVGINQELINLIEKYLLDNKIDSGYIFLSKNKSTFIYMKGILEKIIKEAGLVDFHIHDLRHTFASTSAENGASLLDIMTLLGHKSLVMARRYSHLTQEHTDSIARNVADYLDLYWACHLK